MNHICIRDLIDLSKWGFLYNENFRFCEHCTHGKQHKGVTFDDSALLRRSKQVCGKHRFGCSVEGGVGL